MAPSPSVDADQMRDLNALMSWLRTFPRFEKQYDECQDTLKLLDDMDVSIAILFCADEICDVKMACESCKKDTDTIWSTIAKIVATKMPQVKAESDASMQEIRTFLLSALLCFAVSESCPHRRTYIERIMGLPSHCQHVLMMIIEKGRSMGSPQATRNDEETPKTSGSKRNLEEALSDDEEPATLDRPTKQPSPGDRSVEDSGCKTVDQSWAADDSFASAPTFPGYTPQRRKSRLSVESLFSPTTIDSTLETLVADLRKENESLKQELATSQQREAYLNQKVEENEVAFRKEMMKLESTSLQREEDTRKAHSEESAALRMELEQVKEALETEQRAHKELESVRDEMDLLQHTKEKLAETEEKFRICRERIEQLGDVKEALTREEEAHSASVDECLRLQNELKALQPLRRQLEDYKTRAVEAEVKLSECQADLKRMEQMTGNLSSAQKEILQGAKIHKEEAEELRRRLLEEGAEQEGGQGVGEGLSELNPELMEEMARLRNENVQLKAFAEAREDDAVQMLNERLDDTQRLSNRYKDQYLSTKSELEHTELKLRGSQEQVAQLNGQVDDLNGRLEKLGHDLDDCKLQLSQSQDDLARTKTLLEESMTREESLRGKVEQLTKEANDANGLAAHRLELLESTNAELEETVVSLMSTQEQEQQLQKEVMQWTHKTTVAETALSECENQLAETKATLDETNKTLDSVLEREAYLKDTVADLESTNQELEDKIQDSIRSMEEATLAAENELNETKRTLAEKAKKELKEVKESMIKALENERAVFEQALETASKNYAQLEDKAAKDIAQLEEQYENDLQQAKDQSRQEHDILREQYEQQIANIEKTAADEREKLIEKGKGMLRESKARAKDKLANVEEQLQAAETELTNLHRIAEVFEEKAKKQIRDYKKKLSVASSRIDELSTANESLDDQIRDLERARFKLQEENERFRRQLGGRFGADGKVQNQLETLLKEFDVVIEENRNLKKEIEKIGKSQLDGLSSISESSEFEAPTQSSYTRGGVSGSTLAQIRREYDQEIEALMDEKRELVMKQTAAMTDVQKAEQRAWESEKQVQNLKEELTSLKLKLQRIQQTSEESSELYHDTMTSFDEDAIKENPRAHEIRSFESKSHATSMLPDDAELTEQSKPASEILLDLSYPDVKARPLSESTNAKDYRDIQESVKFKIDAYDFPPVNEVKKRASPANKKRLLKPIPSLLETAMSSSQGSLSEDAQPECKQS